MADYLNPTDVFTVSELCAAINVVPNKYGRVQDLGLFPAKGSSTTKVSVEEKNGVLSLLTSQPQSAPAQPGTQGKRKMRTFNIPRFVHDDDISPEDIQNLRAFGSDVIASMEEMVNEKLATMRSKHDITLEWLRCSALAGVIKDGDGTTIYDLFSEFGITQNTVDFVLGTATTNVLGKTMALKRLIEQNLKGDNMSGIRVLCSDTFFDAFVNHAKVQAAYANWQAAQDRLGGDLRMGFSFGGVIFENYSGTVTDAAGSSQNLIAAGDGRAFPVGTNQTFATVNGPADFNDAVGKPGQAYYAKIAEKKHGRGYEVHTQSNPLPICYRPSVLVRCFTSN
jgi:hypothetical protein